MEATGVGRGKHVLDVGCGAGISSSLIEATGATVVGVDAAQGMVDHANKTFGGIDFGVGGIEELAFFVEYDDRVASSVEHIDTVA